MLDYLFSFWNLFTIIRKTLACPYKSITYSYFGSFARTLNLQERTADLSSFTGFNEKLMYVHRQYIYRYCVYIPFKLTFNYVYFLFRDMYVYPLYQPLRWHRCVWVYMINYWFTRIFISPHNYTLYSRLMGNTFFISCSRTYLYTDLKGTPLRSSRVTHLKMYHYISFDTINTWVKRTYRFLKKSILMCVTRPDLSGVPLRSVYKYVLEQYVLRRYCETCYHSRKSTHVLITGYSQVAFTSQE